MIVKALQFILLFIFFTVFTFSLGNCTATKSLPFEVAEIRFEQNATDGDVEVVFEIKAGDKGLTELKIVSPDGRVVVNINSPDVSTIGIRQFRFESPEPKDVKSLMSAYPEGEYVFSGMSTDGKQYKSTAKLNHTLPSTVSFLSPEPEAEDVAIENLIIRWSPVENAASYIIEIDQDELHFNITAKFGGNKTSFPLPDGILESGKEYTIGIGAVSENGNMSVVETSFTTSK
jgi:hypothetical protein